MKRSFLVKAIAIIIVAIMVLSVGLAAAIRSFAWGEDDAATAQVVEESTLVWPYVVGALAVIVVTAILVLAKIKKKK